MRKRLGLLAVLVACQSPPLADDKEPVAQTPVGARFEPMITG